MPAAKRKISECAEFASASTQNPRRTTRLTTRVSELNPLVTLFEPTVGLAAPSISQISEDEPSGRHDLGDDSPVDDETGSNLGVPRSKRVKLEIADLEDLAYTSPVSIMPRRTRIKQSLKKEEDLGTEERNLVGSESPLKSPSKPKGKMKAIPQTLDKPHPAPEKWEETYNSIKEMRSTFVAPVDTMGCDSAQTRESDPRNRRYATLVSLMLSSQTKDEVTDAAVKKIRAALGGSISIEGMIAADDIVISEAIAKVGFWRRKTGYLKQAAIKLRDDFDSDLPKTVDELCSLPGVGPKMAFLALQIAWNLNHGIGVDVHVHRITNLLGWHKPPTKTPEQTRLNLQSWLPKHLHGEINHLLVGFGQVICVPLHPKCNECQLSTKGLCPSARKVIKSSKAKTRKTTAKLEIADPDAIGEDKPSIQVEVETLDAEVEQRHVVKPPGPSAGGTT